MQIELGNITMAAFTLYFFASAWAAISMGYTLHKIMKKITEFVDHYSSTEYCECPCHDDEDEWKVSDFWE